MQQVELGATVHLTLEQLEFVDVTFGLPVAPAGRQRGLDGAEVLLQAEGKGLQGLPAAGFARLNHRVKAARWRVADAADRTLQRASG